MVLTAGVLIWLNTRNFNRYFRDLGWPIPAYFPTYLPGGFDLGSGMHGMNRDIAVGFWNYNFIVKWLLPNLAINIAIVVFVGIAIEAVTRKLYKSKN